MTFNDLVKRMPELLQKLKTGPLLTRENLKRIPQKGVYEFYEKGKPLWVGRSNRLKNRILEHGSESSLNNKAQFAYHLAEDKMKVNQGAHSYRITRKEMDRAPGFEQTFFEERLRVKGMEVRVVGINDRLTQALF